MVLAKAIRIRGKVGECGPPPCRSRITQSVRPPTELSSRYEVSYNREIVDRREFARKKDVNAPATRNHGRTMLQAAAAGGHLVGAFHCETAHTVTISTWLASKSVY